GTVYVSTANMNCARLRVDFETNPLEPHHELEASNGKAAFGVVQDANHKTITLKEDPPHRDQHLKNIVRALTVPDGEFEAWCAELDEMTRLTMINGEKDRY